MGTTSIAAIETNRLHLLSMTTACLQALFAGDYQQAQAIGELHPAQGPGLPRSSRRAYR